MHRFNRLLILVCSVLALSGKSFSYVQDIYYIMQFKPGNLTNNSILASFTNMLVADLAARNYVLLDGINPGPYREEADYILNGFLSFQGDSYQVVFRGENLTNRKDRWEDTVYTMDIRSLDGLKEASEALAIRLDIFRKGKIPDVYRERTDFEKKYGRSFTTAFNRKLNHIEILNFLSVSAMYPYGYDFGLPVKFGLDFFEYNYIWIIQPSTFGGGVGAKVFSYKGTNAMAFLPVQAYVPIYIFPDDYDYNRRDLYFVAEAGFFIPQASYVDLSLKLEFNGLSISVGWIYLPAYASGTNVRPEYWTFYGGITFSFGKYAVKWE